MLSPTRAVAFADPIEGAPGVSLSTLYDLVVVSARSRMAAVADTPSFIPTNLKPKIKVKTKMRVPRSRSIENREKMLRRG
jgi:hypothetical protein